VKKVSVIVPVYGVEKYIQKCLDSLVNQTLEDIEIIVINDGTKDNSQIIIDDFKKEYPKKIISIIKENEGQAIARNIGTSMATGEYIMYVDSDDWVDYTMLEKMYNNAKKTKADIVICDHYQVINDKLKYILGININASQSIDKSFLVSASSITCAKLFRKKHLEKSKLKFLEHHVYEDIATVPAHIIFTSSISHVNEPLYYYLIREGSTMNQITYNKKLEDIFDSMDNIITIFQKYNKDKKYIEELEYLYIIHLLHEATLRFIKFDNYRVNINKIIAIMKKKFPNWSKNKYYKKENIKYKIICRLVMMNQIKLVKMLIKG